MWMKPIKLKNGHYKNALEYKTINNYLKREGYLYTIWILFEGPLFLPMKKIIYSHCFLSHWTLNWWVIYLTQKILSKLNGCGVRAIFPSSSVFTADKIIKNRRFRKQNIRNNMLDASISCNSTISHATNSTK